VTNRTSIRFLGATGTVTGSKFLIEHEGFRVLVDCGLFQGLKNLRMQNRATPPVNPSKLNLIVLTHAHIDHTGYLPLMVKRGYEGDVLATHPTVDLCGILLPDSGYLQEEDARWANRRGYSKHQPAEPLYTQLEARASLKNLRPVPFDETLQIHDSMSVRFRPAGHILGAAIVEFRLHRNGREDIRCVFSGDLGRCSQPIIPPPSPLPDCDHLVMECTYGNRDHPDDDPKDLLEDVIRRTAERGGMVVIPAFAVGRTQALLFILRELQNEGRLPRDIPIHIDSPMAIQATKIFTRHRDAYDLESRGLLSTGEDPLGLSNVVINETVEQSKSLNDLRYPAILISASGMATGGRVLHHLGYRLPDHRNTVLFGGYQAVGTRGRLLQEGRKTVRIHGREVRVRADVLTLDGLSAHADRKGLMTWLESGSRIPEQIHLVHGESEARTAFADQISGKHGHRPNCPEFGERAELS